MSPRNPPSPPHPIIGQLVIIRNARSLKQATIASRILKSQKAVSQWENGEYDPKLSHISAYAKALNLHLYLAGDDIFPDLDQVSLQDLIDLQYLLTDQFSRRLGVPDASQ